MTVVAPQLLRATGLALGAVLITWILFAPIAAFPGLTLGVGLEHRTSMNWLKSSLVYRLLWAYVLCPLWAYVLCPFWLLGFRVLGRGLGFHRLRIDRLSVVGDSGFLALCQTAAERLRKLDPELHRVLTHGRSTWILQVPPGYPYVGDLGPPWVFSVDPPYVAWQSDGIIARLIYVAFCMSEFAAGCTSREECVRRYKIVMNRSRPWLEARDFPEELARCYAEVS